MEIKAGILAIGNEVVEGQITNRNASWLATELDKLNISTRYHLACVDSLSEIKDSLDFLTQKCNLIIISGGLGPTIDDCTRQGLAQWLQLPLEVNEEEWKEIHAKLTSRQLTIRDGHKNQARFPKGAKALKNQSGVAPGFFLQKENLTIAALPGPPNEMQPMFLQQLTPLLQEKLSPSRETETYKWICFGAPESDIAHITESILSSIEGVEFGYRLHRPYVEAKVKTSKTLNDSQLKLFQKLEEKLKPWLVGHSIEKIREDFHEYIAGFSGVYVIDHLTSGLLLEKLHEDHSSPNVRYQCFEKSVNKSFSVEEVMQIYKHMGAQPDQLFIFLFPYTETSAIVAFNDQYKIFSIPRGFPVRSSIGQLYAIENIFLSAKELLKK